MYATVRGLSGYNMDVKSIVAIPAWTAEGVLPPINAAQPVSAERSPYLVSLTDYVLRLGDTPARRTVLDGLLHIAPRSGPRASCRASSGSMAASSNMWNESRGEPNDMDVVTFYRLPPDRSQRDLVSARPALFLDHAIVKRSYRVDGYLEHLGMEPERLTRRSAYWYSVWSHRRDQHWKRFVQVDLATSEDTFATATLASLTAGASHESWRAPPPLG